MADPQTIRGLQIARVVGVPIIVLPSWFLLPAYLIVVSQSVLRSQVGSAGAYLLAVAFALLLLLSVLLHELGHCLVARALGLPVRSITITLLAGFTEITEPPDTPDREYAVAVSGPMVSVLLTALSVAAASWFSHGSVLRILCDGSAVSNGAIAALNLLPGLPLDGGRVLRSMLWGMGKDEDRATRAAARAGMVIAVVVVPIVLIGVLPQVGVGDRGGVTVVVAAAVAAVIYLGAAQSLKRSQMITSLPNLSAATLARPALAVPATTPLAEAVRRAHEYQLHALVVVDGNGRLEGIVSENWVRQVPAERRPWVVVADGARKIEQGLLLDPELTGEHLLAAMNATPATEYVVRGESPAVLSSSDVAAAMARA